MLRNLVAALALPLLLAPARAADDQYASLKPLLGSWLVDRDCRVYKDKVLVVFTRLPKTVLVEFRDPRKPAASWGKADIVATGEEDHYRMAASLPNNQVLKALNLKSVGGSVVVSTEDEEEELPNNYVTSSSRVSALSSLLTIKLRDRYRKATFLFKTDSPLGGQSCRGAGAKQPAPKAPSRR